MGRRLATVLCDGSVIGIVKDPTGNFGHRPSGIDPDGAGSLGIRSAAAGATVFPVDPTPAPSGGPALSARELEVLRHLGRGLSSQELGRVLGISGETVKSHIKAIFHKLGVADRAEAVVRAYELGLLGTDR